MFSSLTGSYFDNGQPIVFKQDHVTVLLRPSVICFDSFFDATNPDKRGTLVAPYLTGDSADINCNGTSCTPAPVPNSPIVPTDLLDNGDIHRAQVSALVSATREGCLPTGRYAINVVYPDGQAWTVPNEAGACSGSEGRRATPT